MTLSIIIVSHNAAAELERSVESIRRTPPAMPHDITVVDNASTDDGIARVRARWTDVQILELPENLGFAAGNNAGIRATRGELILLLNSDTVVPAGAIDTLADRLKAHPDAAVAGPRLVDAAGRPELSFGKMISPLVELRRKTIGRLYASGVRGVAAWVDRVTREERFVDWVSGACLLVFQKRRRSGRSPGRALLPLHRRRGFLRGDPAAWPQGAVHPCRNHHACARTVAGHRATRHERGVPPKPPCVLRKASSTLGALLAWYLRRRGELPEALTRSARSDRSA